MQVTRASCCPSKLSYYGYKEADDPCVSKSVFLRKKGLQKAFSWELKPVDESNGIYAMFAKVRLAWLLNRVHD